MFTPKRFLFIIGGFCLLGFSSWLLFSFFGVQTLFTDRIVHEEIPSLSADSPDGNTESPVLLSSGVFMQGDSTYTISGNVLALQENNSRTLAFTDFSVSNGPDLFVYVVSSDAVDNDSIKTLIREGNFVSLGALKGNVGDQTYAIPEDFDLENAVVSIWCERFSRNFGMASLVSPPQSE